MILRPATSESETHRSRSVVRRRILTELANLPVELQLSRTRRVSSGFSHPPTIHWSRSARVWQGGLCCRLTIPPGERRAPPLALLVLSSSLRLAQLRYNPSQERLPRHLLPAVTHSICALLGLAALV